MSRLTELIRQAKDRDPALGAELEREYRVLAGRRAFGLNFERHRPEAVDLPSRPVRRGDKVRRLPPRGSLETGDRRLWRVVRVVKLGDQRTAHLQLLDGDETATEPCDDLIVVAEFRDPIHPGLISTGSVQRGGDKPAHSVINGENFHVLKALTYTHRGRVDAIYIDPPYNTGARDWKYNNDYVEGDDIYRHSKWLAFMERRLLLAKELLNPTDSVLIVTIDENELHRLGLLVTQVFPDALTQLVTIVINPSGASRGAGLSRVEEYALVCFIGGASPAALTTDLLDDRAAGDAKAGAANVRWEWLLRGGGAWYREQRPNLCYPVLLNTTMDRIIGVGEPWSGSDESNRPAELDGNPVAWPVRTDGRLGIWRVDGRRLAALVEKGYAYVSDYSTERRTWTIRYLLGGTIRAIEDGSIEVVGRGERGQVLVSGAHDRRAVPKTVWKAKRHIAGGAGGTQLLANLLGDRNRFPFPKSLYAVEDALAVAVRDKPSAIVLDFFAGSGTTAHALMRLNRQDGGRRQCIAVTNNEVSAEEQRRLRADGLRPGDVAWEALGICDFVTKPRIEAAITGRTPAGDPIQADYRFTDEFPMAEGFEENAEFFTLSYESPVQIGHNRAFARVAPLLWLRAGAEGRRIDELPTVGWDVADTYGLLVDLDRAEEFATAVDDAGGVRLVFVVTDDDRRFQSVARRLRVGVEPVRLYESYLTNFRFSGVEP